MSEPSIFAQGEGQDLASDLDLRRYVQVLRQYWVLIALLTIVGGALGYVRYSMTPRMYRATTVVQIDRRTLAAQVGASDPWLENWWSLEFYPTQYRLLRSRGLAEKLILDLRLDENTDFNPGGVPLSTNDSTRLAGMAAGLQGGVRVNPIEKTQLVEIEYRSSSAELAQLIANGLAQVYKEWNQETRKGVVDDATSFLADQIEELKAEIQRTDRMLKEREVGNRELAFEIGSESLDGKLETLQASYTKAVADRIEVEAAYNAILAAPRDSLLDGRNANVVASLRRELEELQRRYASQLQTYKPEWPEMVEMRAEIERLQAAVSEAIDEEVEAARETAFAEYRTALREEEQLLDEITRLRGQALDSSPRMVELANLRRELANRQSQLEGILDRQSRTEVESRLQASGQEDNVRVIDRALLPGGPFQPDLRRSLSLGFGAGAGLGVAFALLLSFLDRTVKTSEDLERLTNFPVLGVVVDVGAPAQGYGYRRYGSYGYYGRRDRGSKKRGGDTASDIELVPALHPRLAVSESYRSLRAALLLSSASQLKTLSITSATAGEGKSSTTVNLACVMAQLGRRVLLVDGDLRKPRQQEILGISNRSGLVSVLTGMADSESAIVATKTDNLSVVPAGPHCPNPSELLGSTRFVEVLRTGSRSSISSSSTLHRCCR